MRSVPYPLRQNHPTPQSTQAYLNKLKRFNGVKPRERSAIGDCLEEVSDSLDRVSKSINEIKTCDQTTMAQNNITFIDQLDVSKSQFTMKVRIIRLMKQLAYGSSTKTYKIDMILIDEQNTPVDVIGDVVRCFPMDTFLNKKNKLSKRVNLSLEDLESKQINVTLWDGYAQQFSNYLENNQQTRMVVVIQCEKISNFRVWRAAIGGLGSGVGGTERVGLIEEEIRGIIAAAVAKAIREAIPDLFGLVKTALIEEFDRRYAAVAQVAAAAASAAVVIARS